jgi:aminopeptidase N
VRKPSFVLLVLCCVGVSAAVLTISHPVRARVEGVFAFRAIHYDVDAALHPEDQTIAVTAKIEFIDDQPSRDLRVELHPDLKVTSVTTESGAQLTFERSPDNALQVRVTLPDACSVGQHVKLIFTYAGPVGSEEDSPSQGLRLANVDSTGAYLLLPSRWFPLTNYPANSYTAKFRITAPNTFAVVGTGSSSSPDVAPGGKVIYTFVNTTPAPVGTFAAGPLQLTPAKAEGLGISVYAPAHALGPEEYANTFSQIVNTFSSDFGPITDTNFTIAQMPDGSVQGYAGPGLILISARQWSEKPHAGLLSRLAASQWWGGAVLPASSNDVWLSDGLARYSQALYTSETGGAVALNTELDALATGALMYEDSTPIAQASRLGSYSDEYNSVVVSKGAMVFHMLQDLMGEEAFAKLLREFYAKYSGKAASIADFEKLAEASVPASAAGKSRISLTPFFTEWIDSTGVPALKLDYIVYRIAKGFKVVGNIQQDLDTFRMPIQVKVVTDGNPVTQVVTVIGTRTEFSIDSFGRPKPDGVTLDPDDNVLKSTPKLLVRAAIARGEGQAEKGNFYEAIQDYQAALKLQPNSSLALFRMGEAFFYQKNYQAASNSFRSVLDGDLDPKWVVVWGHIYQGKIYDLTGQRDRAVNEYSLAENTHDDTGGAQAEAAKYLQAAYGTASGVGSALASSPSSSVPSATPAPAPASPADKSGAKPTLNKPN